jgi:hypothetical protein
MAKSPGSESFVQTCAAAVPSRWAVIVWVRYGNLWLQQKTACAVLPCNARCCSGHVHLVGVALPVHLVRHSLSGVLHCYCSSPCSYCWPSCCCCRSGGTFDVERRPFLCACSSTCMHAVSHFLTWWHAAASVTGCKTNVCGSLHVFELLCIDCSVVQRCLTHDQLLLGKH